MVDRSAKLAYGGFSRYPTHGYQKLTNSTAVKGGRKGRAGWGIADQALSSLSNFGLSFLLVRTLTVEAFGAFTLVLTTYQLMLGISRALCTDPLVVRFSNQSLTETLNAARKSTGAAIATAACVALALLVAAIATHGDMRPSLIALSWSLCGLLLQDACRGAFFALGRTKSAAINDGIWVVLQIAVFTLLLVLHVHGAFPYILGWGGAATAAGLAGLVQLRVAPKPAAAIQWVKTNKDLAVPFAGDFLFLTASVYLSTYLIAIVAGLQVAGTIRAGVLLMGPLTVLFSGVVAAAIPEGTRLDGDVIKLRKMCLFVALGLSAVSLVWTLILTALPSSVGKEILGASWHDAHAIIPLMGIAIVFQGPSLAGNIGLRTLGQARKVFKCRLMTFPLRLALPVGGAVLTGTPFGAAAGISSSDLVSAGIWWPAFRRATTPLSATASDTPKQAARHSPSIPSESKA